MFDTADLGARGMSQNVGSQTIVYRNCQGNFLTMQILGPYPRPTNQTTLCRGQKSASLTSCQDGSYIFLSLKTQFQSREPRIK